MSTHSVRLAKAEEAEALADLAEMTFRATYAQANSVEDMDLHCEKNFGVSIQREEIADEKIVTLVSAEAETLTGYAQLCFDERPECIQANQPGEIRRFYVHEDFHGKGIAQGLMNAALDALSSRGCDLVWLGVWEQNPRAISFYGKQGFNQVGEQIFTLGSDPQRDLILARMVAA